MNRFPKITGMALLVAAARCANAQSSMPKTRVEVRSELAEALRNGTIPQGEQGARAARHVSPETIRRRRRWPAAAAPLCGPSFAHRCQLPARPALCHC